MSKSEVKWEECNTIGTHLEGISRVVRTRRYVMALFAIKQNGCRFRMASIKCLVYSSCKWKD